MILRESVKSLLVRYPYNHGKISLPRQKYDIFTNFKICSEKYSIELIDAENRENVKKFNYGGFGRAEPPEKKFNIVKLEKSFSLLLLRDRPKTT